MKDDLISRRALLAELSARLSIVQMVEVEEIVASVPAVTQERCEYCKDGRSFIGARVILGNDGELHDILCCPICGAEMNVEVKHG